MNKQDRFLKRVKEQVGDEYTFLGDYRYARESIPVIHNKCGHIYEVRPDNFLGKNKRRCPKCAVKQKPQSIPFSQVEFENRIREHVGDDYTVLGEYRGQNVPVLIRHNVCGNEYEVTYKNFRRGRRCKSCADDLRRKPLEVFKKEVFELGEGKYELVGEYVSNNTKTDFKHIECGSVFSSLPSNFIAGNRCPNCKSSKGEDRVRKYLETNEYKYWTQVIFDDLCDVHPLRFDFSVKMHNSNKKVMVEYDGEHHYIPVKHWGGEEELKNTQRRDKMKNEYCIKNDIPLIRIPYWEFNNIEKILEEKLKGEQ